MLRHVYVESSAERRIAGIRRKVCGHGGDEEAVCVEAEYGHLLHSGSVRVDGARTHHVHFRDLGHEAYLSIALGNLTSFRLQQVLSLT